MNDERPIPYLYLLGASHSGSTLLAMLLNAHPDLCTMGELNTRPVGSPDEYLCSCRQPMAQCHFWQRVAAEIHRRGGDFDVSRPGTQLRVDGGRLIPWLLEVEHRGPVLEFFRNCLLGLSPRYRRVFARFAQTSRTLVDVLLRLHGARIFVDSSKHAHRLKFLRRIRAFELRVVHLVRDGRAVAMTYMDQDRFADAADPSLRRGGRGPSGQMTAPPLPMVRAADEWRRCICSAEHVLADLDRSRWIRVRYEDLCRDPRGVVRTIFEFVGVDPDAGAEDFRTVSHHVIGNGMRLDSTSEIRLDERWKTTLTNEDLNLFQTVAGSCNRRYGYR